jgi:hypothetical protein
MITNTTKLLLALIVIYFLGVFDHDLWGPLDTRGAGTIWGMYHSGEWAVPLLNGIPLLEKPPLMHWTSLLLITVSGIINEGMTRLPSAIYGLGSVLLIFLWGRKEHNSQVGLCAAFLCSGSLLYLEYAKTTFTDSTLTFWVILSMHLFWWAYSTHRRNYIYYFPLILVSALAFFAKGLVGVAFVWAPIVVFLAYRREWRLFFLLPVFYLPVFSLLVGYWSWKLWLIGGQEFLRIVFVDNQIGRFFTFTDLTLPPDPYFFHKEPFYYYLLDTPLRILPWVILLPGALYCFFRPGKRVGSDFDVYLKFAIVFMLLILHASSAKVSTYMIPLLPILFYVAAVWLFEELSAWKWSFGQWMILVGGLCAGILAFLPPLLIIGLYLAPQSFFDRFSEGYSVMQPVGENVALTCFLASLVLSAAIIYAAATSIRLLRSDDRLELVAAFPGTMTFFFMIGLTLLIQIYDPQRSFKPVVEKAAIEMQNGRQIGLGTTAHLVTGGFSFYLDTELPVYSTPQAAIDFLDNNKATLILQKKNLGTMKPLIDSGEYSISAVDYPGFVSRSFVFIRSKGPE